MSYILITGGIGFTGGNLVLSWLADLSANGIVNVDRLIYASNRKMLAAVEQDLRHVFSQTNIRDRAVLNQLFV